MNKKTLKLANDLVFDDDTWNHHFLPIIETKIDARFEKVPQELLSQIDKLGNIEVARKYFLLFNFKKLKFENEHIGESLKLRSEVIDIINAPELVSEILEEDFKYIEGGPITQELLDKYQVLNKYDWSTSMFRNNYTSSWGIFRNHIIINDAHQLFIQTVEGKKTVYKIVNVRNSILFTNILPNLNFQILGPKKPKEKQRFENQAFASRYHWEWNDDVGILMYFTPWFQEQFLKINNNGRVQEKYALCKEGNFITSAYSSTFTTASFDAKDIDYRYLSVNDVNTKEYFELLRETIIKFLRDRYDALAFVTIIPIIKSESEHRFIEEFIETSKTISNPQNASNIVNYLIHENKMLHNNAFTRVDDFDMYGSHSLDTLISNGGYEYYQAQVNRTRCFSRFSMSSNVNGIEKYYTNFYVTKGRMKRFEKRMQAATKFVYNLIYWTCDKKISYINSNFYHFSNFDSLITFELDLWCDHLKRLYGCNNIVIKNGFASFLIKKDATFDPNLLDAFFHIINAHNSQGEQHEK